MKAKVDLSTIKRLVEEMDSVIKKAESLGDVEKEDKLEFIVEMNKATGLAAGAMTEAALLMGDIQAVLKGVDAPTSKSDLLDKILGPLKGTGSAN